MRTVGAVGLLIFLSSSVFGQITLEQKLADFRHLAGLYAKNYAPYEWKRDTQNFDLFEIGPWLKKVTATRTDLDFYEVMVEYVASLNDAHDVYVLPSNFVARLNFVADIYDGKVLVDFINRARVPATEFPFQIGYEVISIDGVPVEELMNSLATYSVAGNPRSSRRFAANYLTVRPQSLMPHAVDIGDIAVVEMRRLDGKLEVYRIPWTKTGLPLRTIGPVPLPSVATGGPKADITGDFGLDNTESYLAPLLRLQWCRLPDRAILGYGSRTPIFQLPDGFVQRLGRAATDFFYSGTFTASGRRIGFIRIPDYSPSNLILALTQFQREIAFFQQNTDGLIIDDMRNPGGFVSYVNALLEFVMAEPFRTIGFEIRATSYWVGVFSSAVESAKAKGAPDWVVNLLLFLQDQIQSANRELRGRTGPIPLDDLTLDRDPARDQNGNLLAYTKPLMVLVDELSSSGGDAFPATIQINKRGLIAGIRTMGAGGSVFDSSAGVFSEGSASITESLMHRGEDVSVDGYPRSPYIENVGVHPDIKIDYMTRDNLLQGGRPFMDAVAAAMVEHINRGN